MKALVEKNFDKILNTIKEQLNIGNQWLTNKSSDYEWEFLDANKHLQKETDFHKAYSFLQSDAKAARAILYEPNDDVILANARAKEPKNLISLCGMIRRAEFSSTGYDCSLSLLNKGNTIIKVIVHFDNFFNAMAYLYYWFKDNIFENEPKPLPFDFFEDLNQSSNQAETKQIADKTFTLDQVVGEVAKEKYKWKNVNSGKTYTNYKDLFKDLDISHSSFFPLIWYERELSDEEVDSVNENHFDLSGYVTDRGNKYSAKIVLDNGDEAFTETLVKDITKIEVACEAVEQWFKTNIFSAEYKSLPFDFFE